MTKLKKSYSQQHSDVKCGSYFLATTPQLLIKIHFQDSSSPAASSSQPLLITRVEFATAAGDRPSEPLPTLISSALDAYSQHGEDQLLQALPYKKNHRQSDFQKAVLQLICSLPSGTTLSYGELALRAGFPGAARAVGRVCSSNHLPLLIPCHRVIPRSKIRHKEGFFTSAGSYLKKPHNPIKSCLLAFERNRLSSQKPTNTSHSKTRLCAP